MNCARSSATGKSSSSLRRSGAIGNRKLASDNVMKVSLFVTCLVDQLWSSVGTSAVEVLRRVGCEVEFDERQTCCGQPAFNTGYRDEARAGRERFIEVFEESNADAIVSPSGSCTAMVHHYPELFAGDPEWLPRAQAVAAQNARAELVFDPRAQGRRCRRVMARRLTWHDACHGLRDLNLKTEPRNVDSQRARR